MFGVFFFLLFLLILYDLVGLLIYVSYWCGSVVVLLYFCAVWLFESGVVGMASNKEMPSLSIRHGVRVVPDPSVAVEEVLLAAGEQVGHENISYASRMNKAVVVFLKEERFVSQLIGTGIFLNDIFVHVSPLAVPSTRITVSGVPPFIPNEVLERELQRFGKFASAFRTVSLGCKDVKLKHVQSLRRQVFMFLDSQTQTLDVNFRVNHGEGFYMVYASSGSIKCFECGDVGHKRFACPHRQQAAGRESAPPPEAGAGEGSRPSGQPAEGDGSATGPAPQLGEVEAEPNGGQRGWLK